MVRSDHSFISEHACTDKIRAITVEEKCLNHRHKRGWQRRVMEHQQITIAVTHHTAGALAELRSFSLDASHCARILRRACDLISPAPETHRINACMRPLSFLCVEC